MTQEKRKKGLRMNYDVGEDTKWLENELNVGKATEGLENEQ